MGSDTFKISLIETIDYEVRYPFRPDVDPGRDLSCGLQRGPVYAVRNEFIFPGKIVFALGSLSPED